MALRIEDKWLRYALKETVGTPITKEKLAEIKHLDWSEYRAEAGMDWGTIQDIGPLRHCTNLKVLSFDGNSVSDLTPLSQLANLEEIWLVQNVVSDLSPLKNLHKLKKLVVDMNYYLTSIQPLAGLQGLTYLNIGGTQVSDLTPLRDLPGLKKVTLYGIKGLEVSPESENQKVLDELRQAGVEILI